MWCKPLFERKNMKELIGPILTRNAERHYKEIDRAILLSFFGGALLGFSLHVSSIGIDFLAIIGFGLSCYFFLKARYHGLKRLFDMEVEDE